MFRLIIVSLVGLILSKPLGKDVLDYLTEDMITFNTYRKDFLQLTCKLTIYSKMKYMWESEELDKYLNRTTNVIDYVQAVKDEMYKVCMSKVSSINVK